MAKLNRFPVHPFLFAAYPVLALLGHNVTQVPLDVVFRPLLVSLAAALIVFALLSVLLRDGLKACLMTTLVVFLFFTYGQVYHWLKSTPLAGTGLVRHRIVLILYAVLLIAGLLIILRGRLNLRIASQTLNLVGVLLLVVPLFQISRYELTSSSAHAKTASWTPPITLPVSVGQGNRPDVYYIILDGYGRADVIQKELGYDNSPFLDQLRRLGFQIGTCSRSNYNNTQ